MRDFVSSLLCIPSNHGFWKNLCENCRKKKLMNFASKNNQFVLLGKDICCQLLERINYKRLKSVRHFAEAVTNLRH